MSVFHEGELAVQQLAGVRAEADRLGGMLAPPHLGGAARFLGERTFAALTGRDAEGWLWTSPLVGPPGFLDAEATTLRVHALPPPGDPLRDLPVGQAVGLIVVDYARRRRIRVNGMLVERSAEGLCVDVEQAFGNCPKYIRPRHLAADAAPAEHPEPRVAPALGGAAACSPGRDVLPCTTHPDRGVDTSHRGGTAGFIRVEDGAVWWPDYPGNNMFTSFGNLAVDDAAALLVPDFGTGTSLPLSGRAAVEWVPAGSAGDDGGTGRRVRFTVQQVASGALPIREEPTSPRGAAA